MTAWDRYCAMVAREAGVTLPVGAGAPPDRPPPHRRDVEPPRPSRWLERLGSLFAGLALAFVLVALFFIGR
jgi:hypothetical protein